IILILYHMKDKEKPSQEVWFKSHFKMNVSEFYKELNNALEHNNLQSIYQLSKIITRYHFKNLNN
ncbi:MAG: hypothetical protein ACFFG0_41585, partial [Candidatus Thorarchaeota archaeon]